MADYVVSAKVALDDQVSAGAAAATDRLNSLADAMDKASSTGSTLTETVVKQGSSATALINKWDMATKAANELAKAQAALAAAQESLTVKVASGGATQAQADSVIAGLTGRVKVAQAAVDALSTSSEVGAVSMGRVGVAAAAAGEAHAGMYREVVILGHEMMTGNYSRIPGSLVVLAERSGALPEIFGAIGAAFTTASGLIITGSVAAIAGVTAMTVAAMNNADAMRQMQQTIRATRADYEAFGAVAFNTARGFASNVPGVSKTDAISAAAALSSVPSLSTDQLNQYLSVARDVAAVTGDKLPDAAKKLASAMQDPAKAAEDFAKNGLYRMNEGLAQQIKRMQDAGDIAGAYTKLMQQVAQATNGAADAAETWYSKTWARVKSTFDWRSYVGGGDIGNIIPQTFNPGVQVQVGSTQPGGLSANDAAKLQAPIDQALRSASGTLASQRQQITDTITGIQTAIDNLNKLYAAGKGPDDYKQQMNLLNAALADQQGKLANLRDPLQTLIKGYIDSAAAAAGGTGAAALYAQTVQQVTDAVSKLGQSQATSAQIAAAWAPQQAKLNAEFKNTVDAVNQATAAQNQIAAAYQAGADKGQHATDIERAMTEARKTSIPGTAEYRTQVEALTKAYDANAASAAASQLAQSTAKNKESIEYINAENNSLGLNNDARTELLAHLQAEQDLRDKNISSLSDEGAAYLASVDAMSQATAALQKHQQVMQDLDNVATTVFDQVGQAITNAFAQGGKAAVSFGSIARSVMASLTTEVVKIGIVNPLLNATVGGQSRTTLGDLLGSGGGSSGLGSLLGPVNGLSGFNGLLSSGSTGGAVSAGSASAGGGFSALSGLSSIGGGLSLGSSYFGTGLAGVTLFGGANPATLAGAGLPGSSFYGPVAPGASGVTLGGVAGAAGSIFGGFSAGYGLGTTVGGFLGKDPASSQGNSAIGAGLGSIAGFALGGPVGALLGGIGGGIIGGLIGPKPTDATQLYNINMATGTGGMGQSGTGKEYSAQNAQAATQLAQGIFAIGSAITTGWGLDPLTGTLGAKVGSRDGSYVHYAGQAFTASSDAAGYASLTQQTAGAMLGLIGDKISAPLQGIIKGLDFSNPSNAAALISTLAAVTPGGKLDATQASAKLSGGNQSVADLAWIKNTYEPLAGASGSLASSITSINNQFTSLIAKSQQLGLSTDTLSAAQAKQIQAANDNATALVSGIWTNITIQSMKNAGNTVGAQLAAFDDQAKTQRKSISDSLTAMFGDAYTASADYVKAMSALDQAVADERAQLTQQLQLTQAQGWASNDALWVNTNTAGWKAQATVAMQNSPNLYTYQWAQQVNQAADLANFDAAAAQTRLSTQAQIVAAYGWGYTQTAKYAQQMAQLEDSLAAQRLAIIANYAAQAKQLQSQAESSASSAIGSLTSYALQLQTAQGTSPLSPTSQYNLARQQFQAVAGSAAAGNVNSIQQIQSYASAFLSASQNIYGSGANYAADFKNVLAVIQNIASIPQATLTQAFMASQFQTQTDTLAGKLTDLRTVLLDIQTELRMQGLKAA